MTVEAENVRRRGNSDHGSDDDDRASLLIDRSPSHSKLPKEGTISKHFAVCLSVSLLTLLVLLLVVFGKEGTSFPKHRSPSSSIVGGVRAFVDAATRYTPNLCTKDMVTVILHPFCCYLLLSSRFLWLLIVLSLCSVNAIIRRSSSASIIIILASRK